MVRGPRYRFGREQVEEYLKILPPSEPVEGFDDKNALYAM